MAENPKGYELMMTARDLVSALMEAGGETDEIIETAIAGFDQAVNTKMDNYRYVLDHLQQQIDWLKGEAKKMNKIAGQLERDAADLKVRARGVLEANTDLHGWEDGRMTSTESGSVYLTRRTRTRITDEGALITELAERAPELLKRETKIKRGDLTKALEGGQDFEHAQTEGFLTITFR